jgi:hypothetical protein
LKAKISINIILILVVILTVVGITFFVMPNLLKTAPTSNRLPLVIPNSPFYPNYWEGSRNNAVAQNAIGTFWIDKIIVHPEDMQFYYSLKKVAIGSLQAEALSTGTLKVVGIESFGKIGDFEVGIIHATWEDKVDQIIGLKISLLDQAKIVGEWQVTPLIQPTLPKANSSQPVPSIKKVAFHIHLNWDKNSLAIVECGEKGEDTLILLKIFLPDVTPPSRAIYLHVTQTGKVDEVNQNEFAQLRAIQLPTLPPEPGSNPTNTPVIPLGTPKPTPTPYPDRCT